MGRILDIASVLLCIGAGVYLLQTNSVGESSWFEVIGHGMGVYFIGKGLFIARSLYFAETQATATMRLVQYADYDHAESGTVLADDKTIEARLVEAGVWDSKQRKAARARVTSFLAEGLSLDEAVARVAGELA